MGWPKGKKRGPGSKSPASGNKKGSSHKATKAIKDMIVQALDNKGGVKYLEEQADKNPVAFMGLVGKVLPLQITGEGGGPITFTAITHKIVRPE